MLRAAERVTTGETPIAITYLKYVVGFGYKGAPLEYVRQDKMLGHGHAIALSSRALHPNAARPSSTISIATRASRSWPSLASL